MADGSWLRALEDLLRRPSFDTSQEWCNHAIKAVQKKYGDKISIDAHRESFLQFGMNTDVVQDQESNISSLPAGVTTENLLTVNSISRLSTSDASFTGNIFVEGFKFVGDDLIFVSQTITADGQNKVPLDTDLVVVTHMENADETLFSSLTDLVVIYEDTAISGGIPIDDSKVHLLFEALHRQSLRAATAFSSTNYGLITHFYGDLNKSTPPAVTADVIVRVKQFGAGFGRRPGGLKTALIRSLSSNGRNGFDLPMKPFFIVPKNSIILMNVLTSNMNISLSAGFNVITAEVIP